MSKMSQSEFISVLQIRYQYSIDQAIKLWEIAKACAPGAALIGGTTGSVIGVSAGTITVGTLSIPGWAIGFLGGFVAGEIACVAGGAKLKQAFDAILKEVP